MRTIFFLGFELDERLGDRLQDLKGSSGAPSEILTMPLPLTANFAPERLVTALGSGDSTFSVVPGGRQMKEARPDAPDSVVRRLAAALVPLAPQYPLPFYKLEA
jgi:hypothetical protein